MLESSKVSEPLELANQIHTLLKASSSKTWKSTKEKAIDLTRQLIEQLEGAA